MAHRFAHRAPAFGGWRRSPKPVLDFLRSTDCSKTMPPAPRALPRAADQAGKAGALLTMAGKGRPMTVVNQLAASMIAGSASSVAIPPRSSI